MEHTKNYAQILSERILALRKEQSMTQEALAQRLGLSFQAVSKWENGQSCPDIALLPVLADIFGVSVDQLFGRQALEKQSLPESKDTPEINPVFEYCNALPWPDDNTLRGVVALGHKLLGYENIHRKIFHFDAQQSQHTWLLRYDPLNVTCGCSLQMEGNIQGDATAGSHIECSSIGNNATAGSHFECGSVGNNATAGSHFSCGSIGNNATAGGNIECSDIGGDAEAKGDIHCNDIAGNARAKKIVINGKKAE